VISFKYLRSGSPSINNVSDDASNLKSLEKYQKLNRAIIRIKKTDLGFFKIVL